MSVSNIIYSTLQDNEKKLVISFFSGLISVFCFLVIFYAETVESIVSVWWYSETFSHGFLILPICIWLAWRIRDEAFSVSSPPSLWPMLLAIPLGFVWLLANLVGVQVIEQVSFILICILTLCSLLGYARSRILWFPLTFLLFAAPVGDELVPMLMKVTADFTVSLISFSGIPVYREGLYFSLPSGNWSVIEACSGIRYLIASLTMGFLYAYLNFVTIKARVIFVVLSVAVPVVANGLRAYGIVMVGHHSGMELATGVDHLVYGWLFFGMIMFLLFSFGQILISIFEKDKILDTIKTSDSLPVSPGSLSSRKTFIVKLVAIISIVIFWPGFAKYIEANVIKWPEVSLMDSVATQIKSAAQWKLLPDSGSGWRPDYTGYDASASVTFTENDSSTIEVQILTYQYQHQGKELIRNQNVLASGNSVDWKILNTVVISTSLAGEDIKVFESVLKSRNKKIIVRHWYVIDGKTLIDNLQGKLFEAKNKMLFNEKPSFAFFMIVEDKGDSSSAELALFFKQMYPLFQSAINDQLNAREL